MRWWNFSVVVTLVIDCTIIITSVNKQNSENRKHNCLRIIWALKMMGFLSQPQFLVLLSRELLLFSGSFQRQEFVWHFSPVLFTLWNTLQPFDPDIWFFWTAIRGSLLNPNSAAADLYIYCYKRINFSCLDFELWLVFMNH